MIWTNWAREQRCAPAVYEEPGTEAEVVAAVLRAATARRTVKVAGSGHSFSDIACTDGTLMSLARMDRVLDSDGGSGLVRVQAGITLHALGDELAARGLAMENQGDIDAQSLAGALATGTHGTGRRFGNLSTQVRALRIVDGTGAVHDLEGGDDLLAARVAMGALGVVTEVTLQCVPLFTLHRVDEPRSVGDVLGALDQLVEAHDHFEFWAFPHADRLQTRTTMRTDGAPVPIDARRQWLNEVLLENGAVAAAGRLEKLVPRAIPAISRGLMRAVTRQVRVDRSHRVYATRRLFRFTEMEQALPREKAREAIEAVMDLVPRRRLPVGMPIEVRWVKGDDALLSPAHGRDTVYLAVHQFRGQEFEAYFRAVEELLEPLGARPHWGKRHYATAATLAPRYPGWDRFAAVRDRLDPHRMFANAYLRRVLGP